MKNILQTKGPFRRFGLIGYPLGHSLSPFIHERIMEVAGLRGEYQLYELEPKSLPTRLPKLLDALDGLNCTIPYKESVIPYVDKLGPSASLYGAVNTVHGRTGHNTDGEAFAACRVPMHGRRVCVLGAGGVARVLTMEAVRAGATEILIQVRNSHRAETLVGEVKERDYHTIHAVWGDEGRNLDCEVVLNGTPVGMWPHVGGIPVTERQLEAAQVVFDTVYNPSATRLVLQAKSRGLWAKGGLQMLFEQALASQKIWNPQVNFDSCKDELDEVRRELAEEVLRNSPIKLVLTGFMGSGKTHVGKTLATAMSLDFVDLDDRIVQETGQSITEIFASRGEETFRSFERRIFLDQLLCPGSMVVATGGGTLLQEGILEAVHGAGALVIYLDVSLEVALQRIGGDSNRPMLKGGVKETRKLFERRQPLYEAVADLKVCGHGEVAQIVDTIMTAFGWNQ
ncbi:MAG TPA: hypothetical protein DDZ66_02895 [Firmicutes bacterium]|nr:hypothetical protein [Bacillota bacterium]